MCAPHKESWVQLNEQTTTTERYLLCRVTPCHSIILKPLDKHHVKIFIRHHFKVRSSAAWEAFNLDKKCCLHTPSCKEQPLSSPRQPANKGLMHQWMWLIYGHRNLSEWRAETHRWALNISFCSFHTKEARPGAYVWSLLLIHSYWLSTLAAGGSKA